MSVNEIHLKKHIWNLLCCLLMMNSSSESRVSEQKK